MRAESPAPRQRHQDEGRALAVPANPTPSTPRASGLRASCDPRVVYRAGCRGDRYGVARGHVNHDNENDRFADARGAASVHVNAPITLVGIPLMPAMNSRSSSFSQQRQPAGSRWGFQRAGFVAVNGALAARLAGISSAVRSVLSSFAVQIRSRQPEGWRTYTGEGLVGRDAAQQRMSIDNGTVRVAPRHAAGRLVWLRCRGR